MKAVATVIMNRVNATDGEYSRISQGGSIRNILFQHFITYILQSQLKHCNFIIYFHLLQYS